MYQYYADIQPAGVSKYLDKARSMKVLPPAEFKSAQMDKKIKDVYHRVEVEPQLTRPI